jgi:hypothetical protein
MGALVVLMSLGAYDAYFFSYELCDRFETGVPEFVQLVGALVPIIAAGLFGLVSIALAARAKNRGTNSFAAPITVFAIGVVAFAAHITHLHRTRDSVLSRNQAIRIAVSVDSLEAERELPARMTRVGYNVSSNPENSEIVIEECNSTDLEHQFSAVFRIVNQTTSVIVANYVDDRLVDDIALSRDKGGEFCVGNGPISDLSVQTNRFFHGALARPTRVVPPKRVFVSCNIESCDIRRFLSRRLMDLGLDEVTKQGAADVTLECYGEVGKDGIYLGNGPVHQGYMISSKLALRTVGAEEPIVVMDLPKFKNDAVVQGNSTWDNVINKWKEHVVSNGMIEGLFRSMK